MTDEPLLTAKQAAWALGITKGLLWQWTARGVIQSVGERGPRNTRYYAVAEVERMRRQLAGRQRLTPRRAVVKPLARSLWE